MARLGYRNTPLHTNKKGVDWRSGDPDASPVVQAMLVDAAAAKRARRAAKLGPDTHPRRDITTKAGQPNVGEPTRARIDRAESRASRRSDEPSRQERRHRITQKPVQLMPSDVMFALPLWLHEPDPEKRRMLRNNAKKARQAARRR